MENQATTAQQHLLEIPDMDLFLRIVSVLSAVLAYLALPQHRPQLSRWLHIAFEAGFFMAFALLIPWMEFIYIGTAWAAYHCIHVLDLLCFSLPQRLLRRHCSLWPAFFLAFAFQISVYAAAAAYARNYYNDQARLYAPVRFGPAVRRRLHVNANVGSLRIASGKVLPLISPRESLRRHRQDRAWTR